MRGLRACHCAQCHPEWCGANRGSQPCTQTYLSHSGSAATDPDPVLIERCAGSNSRLGQPRAAAVGCYVQRITVDDDLTSVAGVQTVVDLLEKYDDKHAFIWSNILMAPNLQ